MNIFSKDMLSKKYFVWAFCFTASLIAGTCSYIYFPKAMSLLDVEIKLNKNQVLAKTKELTDLYKIGPDNYDQVAYFHGDYQFQNYVELESTDKTFQDIIQDKIYYPYTWRVRHFKENNIKECEFKFTSDGKPYGFIEHISENDIGPALEETDAKKIAESFITDKWSIDLTEYELIEKSNEKRLNGRVDHTFIYENKNYKIGKATLRLTVCISGDKVTTINNHINIPESFVRKYEEMRETNCNIQSFAQIIIYIIYFFLGCIGGIFYLLRRNIIITRQALFWGIILSGLQMLGTINQISQIWFSYPTSQSATLYSIEKIYEMIFLFFIWSAIYTITFIVAEGLTRKAFGNQIQLWKSWNFKALSSKIAVKYTLTAYLLVPFMFMYVVAFYILGKKYFGWWSPSSCFTDPNILSTYLPGFNAISLALGAGFREECMFRAIPIAAFTLIGRRFKHEKFGIFLGFIIQAIIFGAAHANYPTLPGYVRVIELIIPSILFGTLYIRFGLIPGIILHFIYDAILFSLPIFISNAPGILIQKSIIGFCILFPLIITAISLIKTKLLENVSPELYNKNWIQTAKYIKIDKVTEDQKEDIVFLFKNHKKYLTFLAIITTFGLFGLIYKKISPDIAKIEISKELAIEKAQQILKEDNINLDEKYNIFATISTVNDNSISENLQEKYVWQTGQKKLFDELKNTYLSPALWKIRFAKFEGTQTERTKEYYIFLDQLGNFKKLTIALPEQEPGESLSEDKAKELAIKYIQEKFNILPQNIKDISAHAHKRQNRKDWDFVFQDITKTLDIQLRIGIAIAGNKVINSKRYIHLPEEWCRNEEKNKQKTNILEYLLSLSYFILLILAFSKSLQLWGQNSLNLTKSIGFGLVYGIITYGTRMLNLNTNFSNFTTSKSFFSQLWTSELMAIISIIVDVIIMTLLFIAISNKNYTRRLSSGFNGLTNSIPIAINIFGAVSLIEYFAYPSSPLIPEFIGISSNYPTLVFLGIYLTKYLKNTFIVMFISLYTNGRASFKTLASLLLISIILMPTSTYAQIDNIIIAYIATFILISFLYFMIVRYDRLILPIIMAIFMILNLTSQVIYQPYTGSIIAIITTILAIIASSILLTRILAMQKTKKVCSNNEVEIITV